MKVKFLSGARNYIGVNNVVVNPGDIENISDQISSKINKKISILLDYDNKKSYLLYNYKGKKIKSTVIILYKNKNILDDFETIFYEEDITITMPMAGG